jgi:hypothetical protein
MRGIVDRPGIDGPGARLEAGMRWGVALVLVACAGLLACDQDPARSVKIMARPVAGVPTPDGPGAPGPTGITTWIGPDEVPEWQWRPELCPPPPEPSGGDSTLAATGACAFHHRGPMECTSAGDDFVLEATRPAARDATLSIYINVEQYHGPGTYDGAEMLVSVADAKFNFRWFSDSVSITVGPGEKFVELRSARLEALPPADETEIRLSGTIWCRPHAADPESAGG